MIDQASCILVHLVEKRSVGERFLRHRNTWPLHITLVPWFYIDQEKEAALITSLDMYSRTRHGFQAVVGQEHIFTGGKQEVRVNLMADQSPIKSLHTDLFGLVRSYYTSFHADKPYIEDRFIAHITHHELEGVTHRRTASDSEEIDTVTLLRLAPSQPTDYCEVVANFAFKN